MTIFSSPVPVGSHSTSGFRTKSRPDHAGVDWAPKVRGENVPLYAVADATVQKVGNGNVLPAHSGLAVLLDLGTLKDKYGSDRIQSYHGHMHRIDVKVGQRVKAGQMIGLMGTTGNSTGVHLHHGILCNGSFIDSRDWLNRKGIFPGRTAPVTLKPGTSPKPSASKPSASSGNSKADNIAIQKALNAMGIDVGLANGVDGPKQKSGVKVFQRAHGLVDDGVWGPKTQAVFVENRSVQNAIKRMKGVPDNWKSDGFIGSTSKKWIKYTNERQGWGSGSAVTDQLIRNLKAAQAW